MKQSTEIINELRNLSPLLADMEKVNVFSVPEGYFLDLDEKIATTVFLQVDKKENFQKVPEGYFDSLSDKILSRIKNKEEEETVDSEIKSISPALHYLRQEAVFSVPEGYFEELSDNILNKIKRQNAKIVPLNKVAKWWKYAAAAVVAGVITIASLQLFNNSTSEKNVTASSSNSNLPAYVQLASQYKTPKQLQQGIASLSDDEIAKYLEKNTTILDDETLIKNTDSKELPTQDDYLLDDNTLDNYLQKINIESTNKNTQ
ncbi:MAG: hypothetical protein ACTHNG_00065 [Ginsengibacter sp.]